MGHNPATRNTQQSLMRTKTDEKRTPEEILKGIRGNLAAHLSVTPNDIQFLLNSYDSLMTIVIATNTALEETHRDRDSFAYQVVELQKQVVELQKQVVAHATLEVDHILQEHGGEA